MTCEVGNKEIYSQCAELLVRPLYIVYNILSLSIHISIIFFTQSGKGFVNCFISID